MNVKIMNQLDYFCLHAIFRDQAVHTDPLVRSVLRCNLSLIASLYVVSSFTYFPRDTSDATQDLHNTSVTSHTSNTLHFLSSTNLNKTKCCLY